MSKSIPVVLSFGVLALVGCGAKPVSDAPKTAVITPAPKSTMAMGDAKPEKGIVKNALYVNPSGEPICPVTGDPVPKGKEFAKTVYKGVEYHFCCPGCPEEFKKNPAAYAVK